MVLIRAWRAGRLKPNGQKPRQRASAAGPLEWMRGCNHSTGIAQMKIADRYASAVSSSDLSVLERTTFSDSDVLGAAGIAGKKRALAMALARLLAGDSAASHEVTRLLAVMLTGKAHRDGVALPHAVSLDIARAVFAWWRDGTCRPCGGHGYELIQGAPALSEHECKDCSGTGKRPFEREFKPEHRALVRWLLCEVEREVALGAQHAMRALAPRLEL